MAFEEVRELTDMDFYSLLEKTPQNIKFINVSELKTGSDGNTYIYVNLKVMDTKQEVQISFNVGLSDGKILITSNTKIYPLISFVTGITGEKIRGFYDDLKESLLNLEIKATCKRYKIGNKYYYKLVPLEMINQEKATIQENT